MSDTNTQPEVPQPQPQPEQRAISPAEQFRSTLTALAPKFGEMLPPQINPAKLVGTVMTAVNMQPDLLAADRRSLLVSCMRAAQDGLLPDGREAAFVIFGGRDGKKVQYMPMVGGLLKKLRNSGELASISAQVVYAKDQFDYQLGDEERIDHKPFFGADRGSPVAVYAVAKTKDGAVYREVMSVEEVEKVRNVSRARDSGPWTQWWGEMAKKTIIRRICKRLPSSADLDQVLRHDDETYDHSQPARKGAAPSGPLSRLKGALGIQAEPQTAVPSVEDLEGLCDAGSDNGAES